MGGVRQPAGTVTFVFTDIEGSTRLLAELGTEAYRDALAEHRRIVQEACAYQSGYEVDYEGDAFFYAFTTAQAAVYAVKEVMAKLANGPIRIRVGIHTGEPGLDPPKYVGMDVHRAARIMSAANGGQVVLSPSTVSLLEPEAFTTIELGRHRLKDLSAPISLYQLILQGLQSDFPPLRTLRQTNLPVTPTPFLGRDRELREVSRLMVDGSTRLLTLTGPGGTGKTRLALQAAAESADFFEDGVFWVPLAPVRDPALVPAAVAEALEIIEPPGASLTDTIARHVSNRQLHVLLDNCEHLAGSVAELTRDVVQRCPKVVLTSTSREALNLRAERTYSVPTLSPSDGELLFAERARAVRPDFEADDATAAICESLDQLPLAIELAAARTRALSSSTLLEQLGERLTLLTSRARDIEERQRTLEATIAWSYELLDTEEQRAFRALSVFAGGCTLAVAGHVARADLDLLESLLDKSLLRHRVDRAGEDRYFMLETIREYAARELKRHAESESILELHVASMLSLLRDVAPRWAQPARQEKFDRVFADESNLRVALNWAVERQERRSALELIGLVGRGWFEAGRLNELVMWARAALSLEDGPAQLDEEGTGQFVGLALLGAGWADLEAGRLDTATEAFASAVERFQVEGLAREAAYATMCLGMGIGMSGSLDKGLGVLREALAEFERLGDEYGAAITRGNLRCVLVDSRPLGRTEAQDLATGLREEIEFYRRIGDAADEASATAEIGFILVDAGEPQEAWSLALRAAALMRERRTGWPNLARVVVALARAAVLLKDAERALLLTGAKHSVETELQLTVPPAISAALEAAEAEARKTVDDETAARAIARGEAMTVDALLTYLGTLK